MRAAPMQHSLFDSEEKQNSSSGGVRRKRRRKDNSETRRPQSNTETKQAGSGSFERRGGNAAVGRQRLRLNRRGWSLFQQQQRCLQLRPLLGFALGGVGRVGVGIKLGEFSAQSRRHR